MLRPTQLIISNPTDTHYSSVEENDDDESDDKLWVHKPSDPVVQYFKHSMTAPPPKVLVTQIETRSGAQYRTAGVIKAGSCPWFDRNYKIRGVLTGELSGGVLVQTAMEDKARIEWDFCSFVVNQPCYVYLLVVRNFSLQIGKPSVGGEWLVKSFHNLSATVSLDWHHRAEISVWRSKQVVPRGKVIIGGLGGEFNYSIVIKSCHSSMTYPSPGPRRIQLYSEFFSALPDSITDPYKQGCTQQQVDDPLSAMLPSSPKGIKRKRSMDFSVDVDSFLSVDTQQGESTPALLSPDLSDESCDDSSKLKKTKPNEWLDTGLLLQNNQLDYDKMHMPTLIPKLKFEKMDIPPLQYEKTGISPSPSPECILEPSLLGDRFVIKIEDV